MVTQPAYIKNLKEYARGKWPGSPLDAPKIAEIMAAYESESDRGAIVLAATHLEDHLRLAILGRLPTLQRDETSYRAMFENSGPLATFSSLIAMAHGMGLADDKTRRQMDLTREIRNACAHSRKPISLKTPALKAAILGLLGDTVEFLKDQDTATLRMAFILHCYMFADNVLQAKAVSPRDQILAVVTQLRREQEQKS